MCTVLRAAEFFLCLFLGQGGLYVQVSRFPAVCLAAAVSHVSMGHTRPWGNLAGRQRPGRDDPTATLRFEVSFKALVWGRLEISGPGPILADESGK